MARERTLLCGPGHGLRAAEHLTHVELDIPSESRMGVTRHRYYVAGYVSAEGTLHTYLRWEGATSDECLAAAREHFGV